MTGTAPSGLDASTYLVIVLSRISAIDLDLTRNDHTSGSDAHLRGCSSSALDLLRTCLHQVLATLEQHAPTSLPVEPQGDDASLDSISSRLASLVRLCDQTFLSYHYAAVPACWRRLYTDASILKACAALILLAREEQAIPRWRSLVRDLDLVIIVAGSPGEGRAGMVHDLIRACQQAFDRCSPVPAGVAGKATKQEARRSNKKRRLESPATPIREPTSLASCHIDVLEDLPSLSRFLDTSPMPGRGSCQRPFIVRDFAQDWPASQPAELVDGSPSSQSVPRWASARYLERLAGPGRVVPVEIGAKYTDDDWGQDIILWSDFLRSSGWSDPDASQSEDGGGAPEKHSQTLYLAQHDLLSQFPALRSDIVVPDLVYSSPPVPREYEAYRPPGNDEQLILMAWMGPEGTVSPPHHDSYYNCFVQVVGYKEIWLAPPSANEHGAMSSYGSTSGSAPSADPSSPKADHTQSDEGKEAIAESLMTNTSRLDVFLPRSSEGIPPRFENDVMPVAQRAVLRPGDLLFMPPGWWHSLKSLTKSFSVSMWF